MFLSLLISTLVFASEPAQRAPDFALEQKGSEIDARAPSGFHFNLNAPAKLEASGKTESPSKKSASLLEFPSRLGPFSVTAYLCDNAETFCEKHVQGHAISSSSGEVGATAKAPRENGFILNDDATAFKEAHAKNEPVLIDFFGIWCPPCNELDEEVFSKAAFKTEAKNIVKLKMDADSSKSWTLKSKYKVGGYPTLIFVTSDGDEILRVVGFRPLQDTLRKVRLALANKNHSYSKLVKEAPSNQESSDQAGLIEIERQEFGLATVHLEKSKQHREEYLGAKIQLAKDAALKDRVKLYELKIDEFPDTLSSLDSRNELADLYKDLGQIDKQKQTLTVLISACDKLLLGKPTWRNEGYFEGDFAEMKADAYEKLEDPAKAKSAWKDAAGFYQKKIASFSGDKPERGYTLELGYALWKSGKVDQAQRLYEKTEAAYPEEFTFYYNHASLLNQDKLYAEAEPKAAKAFSYSYGDNKLRAAKAYATALIELRKKDLARTVINEALAMPNPPAQEANRVRTNRYVKALKELQAKL